MGGSGDDDSSDWWRDILAASGGSDALVRAVTRARVAETLFASKQQVRLGRYHLLELVGTGGMGVVWGAWDPDLERRVAIKLVKPSARATREQILAEGQALARLSHPNVVAVHDVGVVDDQIYIVMEWVRGETLRAYFKTPRSVAEIVAVYRAAGEGLSAAHRAGLVHRDFKPDNAMIGDDGRVRVLDFGLARGEVRAGGDSTPEDPAAFTRGAGTPRYMAPEQVAGDELLPAADQYAFGVSLREALAGRTGDGQAALPRWLADITVRATAAAASDRYPTMDALLHALARDPATVRRRRLVLAAGALGVAFAAFAIGQRGATSDPIAHCSGGAHEIAKTWNPGTRVLLGEHLRGLGPYGAGEAERLDGELGGFAQAWAASHRDACLANRRGELTQPLYERSLACLTRARIALETVVGLLGAIEHSRLPDAAVAVRGLPAAERCVSEAQTQVVAPPHPEIVAAAADIANEIERARILVIAQAAPRLERASAAARRAEALGYLPLIARAQLVLGRAALFNGDNAIAAFVRARSAAFEAGDLATAIEAYAREIYALAVSDRSRWPAGDALGAATMAEAIARGLDPRGAFARALLYNNLGTIHHTLGDRASARAWYERAIEASQLVTGERHELAYAWSNLALMTEDRHAQGEYLATKFAALERELGPEHPATLTARIEAALVVADPRASAAKLRELCEARSRLHPHLVGVNGSCMFGLGWILAEIGEREPARSVLARIASGDTWQELAAGHLLLLDGKLAEAARSMAALADELEQRPEYWERYQSADARLITALAELGAGRTDAAVRQLQRTLATQRSVAEALGTTTPYRRRRARVEALLARALATSDRPAAVAHARAAAAWYRTAGGYDAELAELTAILRDSQ